MNSYIPDYPRPQLVRNSDSWENLNGQWLFAFDDDKSGISKEWYRSLDSRTEITVPFTYETKMSGIGDGTPHETVWYSRKIQIPEKRLHAGRVLIHFEGCDYQTQLWVNGIHIGAHTGGYSRFSFDITDALSVGENTVILMVTDPADEQYPRGKQRWIPQNFGCWYVQTTGIWKTVWLEFVPDTYLSALKLTPHLTEGKLEVEGDICSGSYGKELVAEITASFNGAWVNSVTVPVTTAHVKAELDVYSLAAGEWGVMAWSPESPSLYDLEVRLLRCGEEEDLVRSYFGMREIRIDGSNVLLNGSPLYQRLILDQGYWEDSHLTPPSEAALIEDITKIQQLGYNGVRKHQKVEDERFLYWCDVKGLLVWGEMAAGYRFTDNAVDAFARQWIDVVRQNYSHPCIITWTAFNESWGVPQIKTQKPQQDFTKGIYYLTKSIDPYRPVIVNDGWDHTVSDIITLHDYEEKGSVLFDRYTNHWEDILQNKLYYNLYRTALANGHEYRGQPVIVSEFGGIAYNNDDSGWGYGNKVTSEEEFLARFDSITTAIKKLPFCGYCYTQVSDVQQEINGLMNMKRDFKANPDKIREINLRNVSSTHN